MTIHDINTLRAASTPSANDDDDTPQLREGMCLGRRWRVQVPFSGTSKHGHRFMTCELQVAGLTLRAYAWEQDCDGFHVPRHGERVYAAGRIRWRDGRYELVCRELLVEDVAARIRWARERMTEMVRAMQPTLLGTFLRQLFADPKIGPAFLVAPASLNHHHAFSGGLLVHSAETAWSVFRWTEGQSMQGLTTAAAMLHDIGKVRTLSGNMTRTRLGALVRHEDLTLEVLAEHLRWLDGQWSEGAITLRHLLTAQPRGQASSPAYAALELVRTADRISACQAPADGGMAAAPTPE